MGTVLETAHGINRSPAFKFNKCTYNFKTEREITNHIKEDHRSYKPCDYFLEDRCELDGDCRFNHTKLDHGQQICYTCGDKFNYKRDMFNHIKEKHGDTVCHRYLQNKCTVKRCFFKHTIQPVLSVRKSAQAAATAPKAQDFPNLPTNRPVVWSQVEAQSSQPPEAQATKQTIEALIKQMETMLNQMNIIQLTLSHMKKTNN